MAQVNVTISGVLFDKYSRVGRPVTLVGLGTIIPADSGGGPPVEPPGGNPPGIWPGPGDPDYPAYLPHPEHPIVLPPGGPPVIPPSNPPSVDWKWGWSPTHGWHPVYVPGDKPQPPPVMPDKK